MIDVDVLERERTCEEQLEACRGELREFQQRCDQAYESCDVRGAEITRLRQGLSIIAGAPASLSKYGEQFHVALCRTIAQETLLGCRMGSNERGAIVYTHIPKKLVEKRRLLEEEAWRKK